MLPKLLCQILDQNRVIRIVNLLIHLARSGCLSIARRLCFEDSPASLFQAEAALESDAEGIGHDLVEVDVHAEPKEDVEDQHDPRDEG